MIETRHLTSDELSKVATLLHRRWRDLPLTFWLDSGCDAPRLGRYSFLGTRPHTVIRCHRDRAEVQFPDRTEAWAMDPLTALRRLATPVLASEAPYPELPFSGGLVGYLSYDVGVHMVGLTSRHSDTPGLPGAFFGLYDAIVCIDHSEGRLHLISTSDTLLADEARAAHQLAWLRDEVEAALATPYQPMRLDVSQLKWRDLQDGLLDGLRSEFTRSTYIQTIGAIKRAIEQGRIQQVNLSQHFSVPTAFSGSELYERLRHVSPAPFGAALRLEDRWILSSSPERFVSIRDRHVETRPIKGTRPRSSDPAVDERNRKDLLTHPKDRAEHTMIVDLERTELQQICAPGSVHVPELMTVEAYRTVYQLVSSVRGKLLPNCDAIDCLKALFPGGSITGAPKLASMQVIDALEPVGRGIYTGAIGYLGPGGNADFSVAIRTIVLADGLAHFNVGGAIVADSKPEDEYEETLDKAEGIVRALLAREVANTP